MVIYYNNREISISLKINLSRWKRWSREFLPPDPLGGLQSGYARQYSMREAFQVALGGHLVGFMKFSVHQARTILTDLEPWLEKNGFFQWNPRMLQGSEDEDRRRGYGIHIQKTTLTGRTQEAFCYAIIPTLPLTGASSGDDQLKVVEFINVLDDAQGSFFDRPFLHFLPIGSYRKWFVNRLHPHG
jgi:hypothetical protein